METIISLEKHPLRKFLETVQANAPCLEGIVPKIDSFFNEDRPFFRMSLPGGFLQAPTTILILEEFPKQKKVVARARDEIMPVVKRYKDQYMKDQNLDYFPVMRYESKFWGDFGFT